MNFLRTFAGGFADLLFPAVCVSCGEDFCEPGGLCSHCSRELLSLVSLPYCSLCGTTVAPNISARDDGCAGCSTKHGRFSAVVRLGPYAGPLRQIIRELKYHRIDTMRRRFANMLAQAVETKCEGIDIDVVVPTPMYWLARLSRGIDHSAILASSVAKKLNIPMGRELVKVRNTPPQVHMSRTARMENVRGAFSPIKNNTLEGASVLLVDDVTTTGATANESAKTLLQSGAERVILAVIAKSEPPTAYAEHWA